jgi:hypothetical protein
MHSSRRSVVWSDTQKKTNDTLESHGQTSFFRYLQGKVVLVLVLRVLCQPEYYRRQHDGDILDNIGVTVVVVDLAIFVEDILQNEDGLRQEGQWTTLWNGRLPLRTTLPASPPAIKANPMKRNIRARRTYVSPDEKPSPKSCSLLMRFTTSMPSVEQIPGIQSWSKEVH